MDALFLAVLNMSLKASYVIAFVIVIRLFLKKFPKVYSYALWVSVLFRLICPFSFDSIFSLIPKEVNIPPDIAYSPKPEINSGITAIDGVVNNVLPPPVTLAASANPMQIWLAIGEAVWLIGIAILIIYSVFTTVKLYNNLKNAKHLEDNVCIINGYKTPFVFGIVNPKIYLPDRLSESEKSYVLLHEQTHIKRLDHIAKLIFFIVTCIHWFNPLVWIAFYLMGQDMELSCDEKVVKEMGSSIKKEYSSSLLSMSTGRRILGGSPIAFGENNTEGRIKNVMNYKKPALRVLILVSIIIVIFIIGLVTNPKSNETIEISNKQEKIEIENLVKSFGGKIKSVSLSAPEDVFNDSLKVNYGEFVSLTLLMKWQKDPTNAPGRVLSSPWPERIDIVSVEKLSDTEYVVNGNIIEVTSDELKQGVAAATYSIILNIKKIEGKWLIDDLTKDEMITEQESAKKRFYIMTANDGAPHGCEYGTTREAGQIDTLEMLSMLGKLQGFVFDEDYVSQQYIEFQFLYDEPKEINLLYIAKDGLQTEYPIDSATYVIKVPEKAGFHSFFADIIWENGEKETVFFSITIKSKSYGEFISRSDVNWDGIEESIYIDKSQIEERLVTLRIIDVSDVELWSEQFSTSHAGWNQLFLCEMDDKQYLLGYNPAMFQGYCTYVYTLFTLEDDKEKVIRTNKLEFDINGTKELDVTEMIEFADEINILLGKSNLLISSNGGDFSFGLQSADLFFEGFSWLDEYKELFAEEDSLESKLQKFSEYAASSQTETNGNTGDYDYDATDPVEVVRADYMSWLKEDYTISMNVLKAEVDDAETQRHIKGYKGSELAETRGWTDEYLDQHFIVVKVIYECELDHNKTFMNDGLLESYVFLTRDPESGVWTIWTRTSPSEIS